jgi:hypothetical protein
MRDPGSGRKRDAVAGRRGWRTPSIHRSGCPSTTNTNSSSRLWAWGVEVRQPGGTISWLTPRRVRPSAFPKRAMVALRSPWLPAARSRYGGAGTRTRTRVSAIRWAGGGCMVRCSAGHRDHR